MSSLSLGNDLGIESCVDLKQRLADHLQHPAPLHLDGSAITRLHTASLQLLYSLLHTRQHAGLETRWVAASPILREAARLLGLTAALELPAQLDHPITEPSPTHDLELAA